MLWVFNAFFVTLLGEDPWKLLPDFTPCTFSLRWSYFVSSLQWLTDASTILCWVLWVLPAYCQPLGGLEYSLSSLLILFWTPSIKVFLPVSMGSTGCTVPRSLLPLRGFWIKPFIFFLLNYFLSLVYRTAHRPDSPPTSLAYPFHSSLLDIVLLPKFCLRGMVQVIKKLETV